MLLTCWSVKGGVGTTVVSVALATALARSGSARHGALLVDLAGDAPAALGLPDPGDPGITTWTRSGHAVAADGLARLEVGAGAALALIPRGRGADGPVARHEVLARLLGVDGRPVVVDAGVVGPGSAAVPLVSEATHCLLVLRPCYLGLRRAAHLPVRPSGLVLVGEPGRSPTRTDVEAVVGAPVVAEVPFDPAIARAVDAGVLGRRVPRNLARALRPLSTVVVAAEEAA